MNTITESNCLDDERGGGEGKEWTPEILKSIGVVDVANVAKAIRDSCQTQSQRKAHGWDSPAKAEGRVEKTLCGYDFPTYLQVQRESSPEDPHHRSPASEEKKCSTEGA